MTVNYRLLTERHDGDLALDISNSAYSVPDYFDIDLCQSDDLADIVGALLDRFNKLNARVRRLENKQ